MQLKIEDYDTNFIEDKENKIDVLNEILVFFNSGFKKTMFTKLIYAHLTLHGGFEFKGSQEEFYTYFFTECDIANQLYFTHAKLEFKRWRHIIEFFCLSEKGNEFSECLYSKWNQYGSYSDLNLEIQTAYKDFTSILSNYISKYN